MADVLPTDVLKEIVKLLSYKVTTKLCIVNKLFSSLGNAHKRWIFDPSLVRLVSPTASEGDGRPRRYGLYTLPKVTLGKKGIPLAMIMGAPLFYICTDNERDDGTLRLARPLADQSALLAISGTGSLALWDIQNPKDAPMRQIQLTKSRIDPTDLRFDGPARRALVVGWQFPSGAQGYGFAHIVNIDTLECVGSMSYPSLRLSNAAWSPDGTRVAAMIGDRSVIVWDLQPSPADPNRIEFKQIVHTKPSLGFGEVFFDGNSAVAIARLGRYSLDEQVQPHKFVEDRRDWSCVSIPEDSSIPYFVALHGEAWSERSLGVLDRKTLQCLYKSEAIGKTKANRLWLSPNGRVVGVLAEKTKLILYEVAPDFPILYQYSLSSGDHFTMFWANPSPEAAE